MRNTPFDFFHDLWTTGVDDGAQVSKDRFGKVADLAGVGINRGSLFWCGHQTGVSECLVKCQEKLVEAFQRRGQAFLQTHLNDLSSQNPSSEV